MRIAVILTLLIASSPAMGEIVIKSPETRTNLIELYTSEGCSSCPPADQWLSRLKVHPQLWHQLVPIAFHVDYWDYIGWQDRFARPEFSERQRLYARQNNLSTVYTPALVLNGTEWRNFSWGAPITGGERKAGFLSSRITDDQLDIRFEPSQLVVTDEFVINITLLGFGLTSDIQAGENAGRVLTHDFVVMKYTRVPLKLYDDLYEATALRPRSDGSAAKYAIAMWVSRTNNQIPIQAVGAWLDD